MTRETKIGLLIGLGFIVVFAVLLSHTGPVPQAGDSRLADLPQPSRTTPSSTLSTPQPLVPSTTAHSLLQPPAETGTSPDSTPAEGIENLFTAPEEGFATLPRPESLDLDLTARSGITITPSNDDETTFGGIVRVAPVPVPGVREELPAQTPEPEEVAVVQNDAPAIPAATEESGSGTVQPVAAPAVEVKEYVVRKGDSLVKIAKDQLGSSSPEMVDAIVKANADQIKDRHMVREGQKIRMPVLPAKLRDMVEPVASVGGPRSPEPAPAAVSSDVKPVESVSANRTSHTLPPIDASRSRGLDAIAEAINGKGGQRQAPRAIKAPKDAAAPTEVAGSRKDSSIARMASDRYVVQPSDTLMDIAKRELGSSNRWKEIEKLNKNIDPRKIRPGVELKMPKRAQPLTDESGVKRVSA